MDAPNPRPPLSRIERRILGVLIEKQKTTPDAYPMSLNGVVVGSNQKSNRDPVMNLTDDAVEEAMEGLQKAGLVSRLVGGRTDKFRHLLYDAWTPDKLEMAILAELLLRGPQTVGELKTRASRMESIVDLEQLKAALKPMVDKGFVIWLTAEDRRGATLTHGFHDPDELERIRSGVPAAQGLAESRASDSVVAAGLRDELDRLMEMVMSIRRDVDLLMNDRRPPSD